MTKNDPNAADALIALEPELMMLPLWRSLTASRYAIDVGAHIGAYTAALIEAGFETWCFEPNPSIFQRLAERFRATSEAHPIKMAASSQSRILPIHLATYRGEGAASAERDALFSALDRHPAFEGFEFVETTTVVAWPLARLASAGMIPTRIGVLKIDTEGHDPEVVRGLDGLRPEIVTVEYWNRDFVFNRGETKNDVGDYVQLLAERGYSRSITFFRQSDDRLIGFTADRESSPANSWGNIVFFRDPLHHESTLEWCRELFADGEPAHGDGLALRDGGEEMLGQIRNRYAMLRSRLAATARAVVARAAPAMAAPAVDAGPVARPLLRRTVDLVVSPNEIASTHGTGILIKRLIEGRPNMLGMRSATTYSVPIEVSLVEDLVLPNQTMDRAEIVEQTARWLRGYDVSSITCVPYFETDLLIGLAAKAITGAPLTVYIMDDNCLNAIGIRREVMQETMNRADAVFAISPELRAAYEGQFLRKIWVMPPLVASRLVRTTPAAPAAADKRAYVLGNIWSQEWLDQLADTLEGSGWAMTWFTANENPGWLSLDRGRLERAGLTVAATPPVDELVKLLTDAPFVIVPSGSEDDAGHAGAIAKLSLPSRMPFVVAATGTPMLVLGSPSNAAAKFVARFGVGEAQAYDKAAFVAAAQRLSDPAYQTAARARAAAAASLFDVAGAFEHMQAVARSGGYAAESRYESMFKPLPGDFAFYVEPPIPPHVYRGFAEIYGSLSRLKDAGYVPSFIMDIGASTGIWSYYASDIYPDATFVLADPMASRYPHKNVKPGFLFEEVAVSNTQGSIVFKVARDLYNSSILSVSSVSTETESIEVPMVTVDGLAAKHGLSGRGILKIDVQYAEHLVLEGAKSLLASHVDFVILELTMTREHPQALTFVEMLNLMDGMGFRPFDDVGGWRSPRTGFLEQKDFVFCRKDLDLKVA